MSMYSVLKKIIPLNFLWVCVTTASTFASNPEIDESTNLKRNANASTDNSAKRQKASPTFDPHADMFLQLSDGLPKKILSHLDCEKDRKDLVNLSGVSSMFSRLVEEKYKAYVEDNHYTPWRGITLSHKVLYITNSRLVKMMTMFDNWNFLTDEEKKYFDGLANRFASKPSFTESDPTKLYAALLRVAKPFQAINHPTGIDSSNNEFFDAKTKILTLFESYKELDESFGENERALYFHFLHGIAQQIPGDITTPWQNSKNPMLSRTKEALLRSRGLMDGRVLFNPPLNPNNPVELHARCSEWLEMEIFPTIRQLEWVVSKGLARIDIMVNATRKSTLSWQLTLMENKKFYGMQLQALDYNNLATLYYHTQNYVEAAKNKALQIAEIIRTGGQPTDLDYSNLARAHYAAKNYVEAAKNIELQISEIKRTGGQPSDVPYGYLARAHYAAKNYVEAAKNIELQISEIKRTGGQPSDVPYGYLARAHYESKNYVEAAKNYELQIVEIKRTGGQPSDATYGFLASAHYESKNYVEAVKNKALQISEIKKTGGQPTDLDYSNLANAYYMAKNYVEAAKNYELQISEIKRTGGQPSDVSYGYLARAHYMSKNYDK